MPYFDFAVIGGDKRLTYMIPILRQKGYRVISYNVSKDSKEEIKSGMQASQAQSLKEAVGSADSVILGIPICHGNYLNSPGNISFKELVDCIRSEQTIFAGAIKTMEMELLLQRTKKIYDFLQDENLAIENACATAEGVILELLSGSERVLCNERILLFGYGRCGKNIALRIKGMLGNVTIGTDDEKEAAWANVSGYQVCPLKQAVKKLNDFTCVINTIPYPFIEMAEIKKLQHRCILYEIASRSCLCNEETLTDSLLEIIKLPGLPGKYKAKSLAKAYTEFVCEKKEGEKKG